MKKEKKKTSIWQKKLPVNDIGLGLYCTWIFFNVGGGSDDPNVFNDEIYNFRRIRLAPFLVVFGFVIEVYAIMKNPN